jgi:hypothetical protein
MRIKVSLLVVLLSVLFSGFAFAGSPQGLGVHFESLDTRVERKGFYLEYRFSQRTWNDLKRENISPQLHLHERGRQGTLRFQYALNLKGRSGKVLIPQHVLDDSRGELIVSVVGYSGSTFVAMTSVEGGDYAEYVILQFGRGHGDDRDDRDKDRRDRDKDRRDRDKDRGDRRDDAMVKIVEKCVEHSQDSAKCIAGASHLLPREAPAIIDACGKTTDWDSDLVACLKSAEGYSRFGAEVILACAESSRFASDHVKCVAAAKPHTMPVDAIKACTKSSRFPSDQVQCLQVSSPLQDRAAQIIEICSKSSSFASDQRKCIQQAALQKRRE